MFLAKQSSGRGRKASSIFIPSSLDDNRRATEWRGGGGAVQGSGVEGRCALFRSASSGDKFRRWLLPSLLATGGAWMIMVGGGGGDVSPLTGEDAASCASVVGLLCLCGLGFYASVVGLGLSDAVVDALEVLRRHGHNEAVVVEEDALYPGQRAGDFAGEGVVAEVQYGFGAVREDQGGQVVVDPTGEIVPLEKIGYERRAEEVGRDGPTEMVHAEVEVH
nr:hypothetical protein Iba_chr01bCG2690 [Ipomoea batatas]